MYTHKRAIAAIANALATGGTLMALGNSWSKNRCSIGNTWSLSNGRRFGNTWS
jgi:hypothetical protein